MESFSFETNNHFEQAKYAVVCGVHLPEISEQEFQESLTELHRLSETLGLKVLGHITQKRSSFDAASYLGTGKINELCMLLQTLPLETLIVVDHEISPSQARNLEKATLKNVIDRTGVILEIFHKHAHSKQAKIQVEIVRLGYMAPRLRESPNKEDRQRGFIGGKGSGESALELDRRKIRDRIALLRKELVDLEQEKQQQRVRRQSLRKVALCGYTNAGKSTLFQSLTHQEVYVADKLFATLDTTVRRLNPETKPTVLVSDTVGFIRHLPTQLITSFKTTLSEVLEASLIVHVVDISDPAWMRHIQTTHEVLKEIGATAPLLLVGNKIDKLSPDAKAELFAATKKEALVHPQNVHDSFEDSSIYQIQPELYVSAHNSNDIELLRNAILQKLDALLVHTEIFVPFSRPEVRAEIFEHCQVINESNTDEGCQLTIKADAAYLEKVRAELA